MSIPGEPIRQVADYVAWLRDTLAALSLDRAPLVGMSYGGRLALIFAGAAPERLAKLVLLSPGGLLPLVRQFSLRGMLMTFFPARVTVNSFMRWAGFTDTPGGADATPVLDLMYLGGEIHVRTWQRACRGLYAALPCGTVSASAAIAPPPDISLPLRNNPAGTRDCRHPISTRCAARVTALSVC